MSELLIYFIGLVLAFYMAWNLGANDAANPTDCAVGAGVITIKRALILFAVFVALGTLLQGYMVMKTVDRGIVSEISVVGAFTAILAAGLWVTFCSWKGIPISTTHSIVGAVIGYGILEFGVHELNWWVLSMVFIGMIASPILSMFLAMGLLSGFKGLFSKLSSRVNPKSIMRIINSLLVIALCFSAYSFGVNDVANSTGVFVTATEKLGQIPAGSAMILLAALGSFGIVLGGFTLGPRVIRTGAKRITRLDPITGLSAEFSNAFAVYLFTIVPFILFGWGIPISTTHSSIGSIIGVGLARKEVGINRRVVSIIVASWFITLLATALLSITLYKLTTILLI